MRISDGSSDVCASELQMRQACGCSHSEYKHHCTWGGHPNPSARGLLPHHRGKVHPSVLMADLGMHLAETVDLLVAVLKTIPSADALVEGLPPQDDLPDTYRRWRAEDPLSERVKIPDRPADL